MQNLFSMDNPLFRFMEKIADFLIVSLLTVLCSLPVFTIGAAVTAAHKTMQNKFSEIETPVSQVFFRAFGSNFKQATGFWLMELLFFIILAGDFTLTYNYFNKVWVTPVYLLLAVLTFVALGTVSYVYPLMARYQNTLKQHIKNGFFLAVSYLPRTIIILLLCASPVLFFLILPKLFMEYFILWVILGIGIIIYAHSWLLLPIFNILEETKETEAAKTKES